MGYSGYSKHFLGMLVRFLDKPSLMQDLVLHRDKPCEDTCIQ